MNELMRGMSFVGMKCVGYQWWHVIREMGLMGSER